METAFGKGEMRQPLASRRRGGRVDVARVSAHQCVLLVRDQEMRFQPTCNKLDALAGGRFAPPVKPLLKRLRALNTRAVQGLYGPPAAQIANSNYIPPVFLADFWTLWKL
jgi:hypothetical protein